MIYVTFFSYLQFIKSLSSCNDQVKIKVLQRRTWGSSIIRGWEMGSLMNLTAEIYRAQLNQTAHWFLILEGRPRIEQIFLMHVFPLKSSIWCTRMIYTLYTSSLKSIMVDWIFFFTHCKLKSRKIGTYKVIYFLIWSILPRVYDSRKWHIVS